jgi:hypothetical protein
MHEATSDYPAPRERLISLLQADFTPSDKTALADRAGAEGNALAGLLSRARGMKEIDARFTSEENIELGRTVAEVVEPAPVTESFKGFIVHEVRKAHAWQSKVKGTVAPDRLGLLDGDGIFDPVRAKDIEGQTLRGYAFDTVNGYTVRPAEEDAMEFPPLLLKPGVRPSDYIEAVDTLVAWAHDYEDTYGEDPGEGLDPEAYRDAAPQAIVVSEEDLGWADFMEQLWRLYEDQQE